MRKWFTIIIFGLMLILWNKNVEAASFKISASSTKVNPNGSFTVSVGGDCIGRVNLSVTNGTLSTSSVWVEQNYQTVSVKAGNSGTVTVTATPAVGFSDADANEYKPGARSAKVSIIAPSTSTPSDKPTTQPPSTQNPNTKPNNSNQKPQNNVTQKPNTQEVEEKSSNNLLAALNTSVGTLEPAFDANIGEYNITLPSGTQMISINAETADNKSRVEGLGETKLESGDNTITIKVIAEDNSEKIYTIKAYVDETPQVYLKYRDKEIGVVTNLKDIAILEGFSKKEHQVKEHTISIFDNEHFSIIYGIDEEKNKNFYIIDTEKNECINKITPITVDNRKYYFLDIYKEKEGFEISTIKIEEKEIEVYKFEEGFEDYYLVNTINNEGEIKEYLYETKEKTLQLYTNSAPVSYEKYEEFIKEINTKNIIIITSIVFVVIYTICLIVLIIKLRKGKSDEKVH